MPENPRIEELRRRVEKDPASIAFAQLAEEYRRAGNYQDAIATCRTGLKIHPSYLSARVTLGRALIEVNQLEAAEVELQYVRDRAPENLAAIRGLAEIHHRRGDLPEALSFYKSALGLARHDPDLEQTVDEISRAVTPPAEPADNGLSFEQATEEFLSSSSPFAESAAAESVAAIEMPHFDIPHLELPAADAEDVSADITFDELSFAEVLSAKFESNMAAMPLPPPPPVNPALPGLERFLDAIQTYRQRRAV